MASEHTVADDIVYDLISIQYHALKGAEAYDKYVQDAHEHTDVVQFIEQCQHEDNQRAVRAHELLRDLTIGQQPLSSGDAHVAGVGERAEEAGIVDQQAVAAERLEASGTS